MLCAATWMELEIVKMSEVSQAEKEKYHMILLICGILMKGTHELINKAEIEFNSTQLCPTCCDPIDCACQASLSITNSRSLFKLMSIESMMPSISSSVVPFSSCLQSLPASGSFPMSQLCIRYWSSSFSINLSNEYSGLISLRIDWFDFLAVQGTLTSLLQHHSLKTSILWHSVFFMVQLSHPCMTTGKTIAFKKKLINLF